MKKWLLCLTLVMPSLSSQAAPFQWQKEPKADAQTIFRRDGWNLKVPSATSLATITASTKHYAVLNFGRGSTLHQLLQKDPRTLSIHEEGERGMALIAFDHIDDGAAYADLAHEGTFSCGNAQIVNFNTKLTMTADIPAPIHDTKIPLTNIKTILAAGNYSGFAAHVSALEGLGTRHADSGQYQTATTKTQDILTAAAQGKIAGMTIEAVTHGNTQQKSVVVKIPGTKDTVTTVVMGAHLDSIAPANSSVDAPGADDDASGIAALAEVLKAIADNGLTFERTIEIHGYAAEEKYLLGSNDLAEKYQTAGRKIAAMMQFDMVGYGASDTVYLVKNDTSATLRRGVKDLMTAYLGGNFEEKSLSAGTSDHKSWSEAGYPAVFPFEDPDAYNHKIHTANDTSANMSNTTLPVRFIKLGIAFLAHYAGLNNATKDSTAPTVSKDLKLAIIKTQFTGAYYVAVSAATQLATVEICKVQDGSCVNELTAIPFNAQKGSRYFYIDDDEGTTAMASGERWRITGYDSSNQLVAARDVLLQ